MTNPWLTFCKLVYILTLLRGLFHSNVRVKHHGNDDTGLKPRTQKKMLKFLSVNFLPLDNRYIC